VNPGYVTCPVCLSRLNWAALPRYRYDGSTFSYVELKMSGNATADQRVRAERGAMVKCPDPSRSAAEHYLPADYGRYGKPVVLGFVGDTRSGKTHLLSAMVGAIEKGELDDYGLVTRPLDQRLHSSFLSEKVLPLIEEGKVLSPTQEKIVSFADALLIGSGAGTERPVAFFDVAGGELGRNQAAQHGPKSFLEIADGLVFVVDPVQLGSGRIAEDTFNTVLELLREAKRLSDVCAAIVVNKADLLRFDDPVSRWLRAGPTGADPDLTLLESADVFAYLDSRGARAWTRPYTTCRKATLHVASATGGPGPAAEAGTSYPRAVTPCRVLTPLVALLAMTGILQSEPAQRVGL
jgi:hypothetical protein